MVQKTENINVGFVISQTSNWLGEVNYFKSLITALDEFEKKHNYKFYVFLGKNNPIFDNIKFKRIKIIKTSLLNNFGLFSYLKKFSSFLFKNNDLVLISLLKKYSIKILSHYKPIKGFKNICWFPDFQHVHLPDNFSKKEINYRNKLYNNYLKNSDIFLVSSKNSKKHLIKFSKKKKNIKVLNFVPHIDFSLLRKKRPYHKKYILTPNQFWIHKNHKVIIESYKILKSQGYKIKYFLTGSNYDHRNPLHFKSIMKKIEDYKLKKFVLYKGVLNYKNLINLIFHSEIIVNPSYFEGWSTVVEEAKILNKKIILSNIDVHKEQNPKYSYYFDPNNPKELSQKIKLQLKSSKGNNTKFKYLKKNYQKKRDYFSSNYISILNNLYS